MVQGADALRSPGEGGEFLGGAADVVDDFGGDVAEFGDVGEGHGRGRHEDEDVADGAEDDVAVAGGEGELVADAVGGGVGFVGAAVADEFEGDHCSFVADVADVGVVAQVFEAGVEEVGDLLGLLQDVIFREQVE